jgi:hypothetical protein
MKKLLSLLLLAVCSLGCDDTELQDFVQEHGATRAHAECQLMPSEGFPNGNARYRVDLFWDGSVFVHGDGSFGAGGAFQPRGSAEAAARMVNTYHIAQGMCEADSIPIRVYQDGFEEFIDGDEVVIRQDVEPNDSCHPDVEYARVALSTCTGFNLEALEN